MTLRKKPIAARRQKQILKKIFSYLIGILVISAIVLYVWIYYEIDNTLGQVEILNDTILELEDDINILHNDIDYLSRVDILTNRARADLNMVFTTPETIEIYIEKEDFTGK
jgi:hypothetical protein